MNLELTEQEARELRSALEIRLIEMRGELAVTDDRHYRADLRATLEHLETVAARMDAALRGKAA